MRENEGTDIVIKDRGAPTADHTNHPMMIIKESIPLTAVGAPGSFHSKLQHQHWSLGAARRVCDDGKNDISRIIRLIISEMTLCGHCFWSVRHYSVPALSTEVSRFKGSEPVHLDARTNDPNDFS